MSDHPLAPLTALARDTPAVEKIGGITITENPELAIASLAVRHGRELDLQTHLTPVLGEDLPGPGRAAFLEDTAAIWTGIGQWFLMSPLAKHPDYACDLNYIVKDTASVTEQTDGWVIFDVFGNSLCPLLERICNLNVNAMSDGDATRCLIEHLGCLIICRESGRNISILGPRSSAASLHHILVTAAKSVA
ncbi:hypothetical protein [uncultured Sneathiella sp.]|uniref:sarcosine oxidase subunit gamma n=1 Tax=uncultured Sneathiella sp. TaxID=879315 RepID=UPI002592D18D|nr:hypothetical protein [uncultured Sneathiella sp.]